jgi:hypothetical protein
MMNRVRRIGRMTLRASLVATGALCFAGSGAYAANITVGTAAGGAGSKAAFDVTLQSQGAMVLGTQNDINYDPLTPVAVSALGNCGITTSMTCTSDADCPELTPPLTGNEPCVNQNAPDCTVKVEGKGGFFAFEPSNCTGAGCTGIRALIFALNNVTTEIPDGSVLYSCNVDISGDAVDGTSYPLTVPSDSVEIADTSFQLVPDPTATDGQVTVGAVECQLLVCDVAPSTGDSCGQFGNDVVNNSDVVAIFRASLLGPPSPSSARFNAMDSITADNPPTCGGNNSIVNNDVVACFKRSLLPTEPNYNRMVVEGTTTCTSVQK